MLLLNNKKKIVSLIPYSHPHIVYAVHAHSQSRSHKNDLEEQ